MDDDDSAYKETNASDLLGEIFGGNLPIEKAIEQLRTKLLDLSSNNRLLKYRHPKGRCISIAGTPNLNQAFGQLLDSKAIRLLPVPDPLPLEFESKKKPDVRAHAVSLGISVSPELASFSSGSQTGRRSSGLQVIQYPADLDRLARKVANDAKTAIEETGSNMLFMIFGFLEFYDSEDSDKALLAPILSLPATLVKGPIDPETRTYQWFVQHNGEDLTDNATLREKLKQFSLHLPEMLEDEEPEAFFQRIEQAVRSKRRWRVKRQMTIGLLSFGKLAVWADLDPKKHPGILTHPLTQTIFKGGEPNGDSPFFAEDYKVDERGDADVPLIYDADSSQHSAIIDVLSGKSVVINGPPGTGKSQTITNIIAAVLAKGKKVLFVSEKLAALEVVQHRLNLAGLGHFCLELHSHKTQKKKFIEDVADRLQQTFRPPFQFQAQRGTLLRLKNDLARIAMLMGSKVGNALDLSINEVFWAYERRRAALGDLAEVAARLSLPQASTWTLDQVRSRRSQVETLAELWIEVGRAGQPHPWEGFRPRPFVPGDDDAVGIIVGNAKTLFGQLAVQADECAGLMGRSEQLSVSEILTTADRLKAITDPPEGLLFYLLPTMFEIGNPQEQASQAIANLTKRLAEARDLHHAAHLILVEGHGLDPSAAAALSSQANVILQPLVLESSIAELDRLARNLDGSLVRFGSAAAEVTPVWTDISASTTTHLEFNLDDAASLGLEFQTISAADAAISIVSGIARRLGRSLDFIESVAKQWSLPFDDHPAEIARLLSSSAIDGLLGEDPIGQDELTAAVKLIASSIVPGSASLDAITSMAAEVHALHGSIKDALERCSGIAKGFGLRCEGLTSPGEEARILLAVSEAAPLDLLRYRSPSLADRGAAEVIRRAKVAIEHENALRTELDTVFHLDAIPTADNLRAALLAFRRGKGFFSFLDGEWRNAIRTYSGIAKNRGKRSAAELTDSILRLLTWVEHRESFKNDLIVRNVFGDLFLDFSTDVKKAERLHVWHIESQALLVQTTSLHQPLDLITIDATSLEVLVARSQQVAADIRLLEGCEASLKDILGITPDGFREARRNGWVAALACLDSIREALSLTVRLLSRRGRRDMSAARIVQLMQAKDSFEKGRADILALGDGMEALRSAGGEIFERLLSNSTSGWRRTLSDIDNASSKAGLLLRSLKNHVDGSSRVREAIAFVEAKETLDQAISVIGLVGRRPSSWDEYRGTALGVRDISRAVAEMMQRALISDKSPADGFNAVTMEARARGIVDGIEADQTMQRYFGGALRGFDTDVAAIEQTYWWGTAVLKASVPSDLCRVLLAPDAKDALGRARVLFSGMTSTHGQAVSALNKLSRYGTFDLAAWNRDAPTLSSLLDKLELAHICTDLIMPLAKWLVVEADCKQNRLGDFIDILREGITPPAALGAIFELATYQSIGRRICRECPEITNFDGRAHNRLREDFKAVDRKIIAVTGQECASQIDLQKSVPEGVRGTLVSEFTEMHLLRREINKQKRHIPIRQLIMRAGRALQELKPCFMMGPLSVAQYLAHEALKFDLIVMDEASQLRPEDAIGVIARGSQLVVVGDPKQLPPTNFFRTAGDTDDDDDDDAAAVVQGMESILDISQQIFTPIRSLRWHYRSQHESLIAFSNHHFYKNLVVFPSPHADNPSLGVKWRYVKDGLYEDRRNIPEAQRIADAVIWHMKNFADESLGVVTLNGTQRDLVEELLERRFRNNDECGVFRDRWDEEGWPFFVKNLENVQGDERDCIMISATFGRPRGAARVRQNFGPISRPSGWRRLNVLFTRAKRRVELFTSMQPEDIVIDEKTPDGTKALRDYLDYAKRGILTSVEVPDRQPDSDFEVAVAEVLRRNDFEVRPQLGVAGYFVDMAVRNPDRPGEWLAAIECDGATYHSGLSVRDRDRIRQEILESLGWKDRIYRIWSTDWFYNPLSEVSKLLAFLRQRRIESAQEQMTEQTLFPWLDEEKEEIVSSPNADSEAETRIVEALLSDDDPGTVDDLFVEVGDRVTYCLCESPLVKMMVLIVDSASNPKHNIVNEQTPIAQALLGLSQSEEGSLDVPEQSPRSIKVLKIDRQRAAARSMATAG